MAAPAGRAAADGGTDAGERREVARVVRLHRSAVRAGAAGKPAAAAKRATEALRLLGWPGAEPSRPALAARLLLTLAHAEAEQGRTELGLELLDRAETLADLADVGTVLQQRGLLLLRVGEIDAALKLLDAAVPVLQEHGEPAVLARTLLNRGVVHLTAGRVRLARADLLLCRELAGAHGLDLLAAKVEHNLGYCALAGGDVPAALQTFDTAADSLRRLRADGFLAISMLDRARALLGAGLDTAAAEDLDRSIELLKRHRLSQDLGEAELARAQAALGSGDLAAAALWSARARARFTRRRNRAWAALAASLQVRVDLASAARTQAAAPVQPPPATGPVQAPPSTTPVQAVGLVQPRPAAARTQPPTAFGPVQPPPATGPARPRPASGEPAPPADPDQPPATRPAMPQLAPGEPAPGNPDQPPATGPTRALLAHGEPTPAADPDQPPATRPARPQHGPGGPAAAANPDQPPATGPGRRSAAAADSVQPATISSDVQPESNGSRVGVVSGVHQPKNPNRRKLLAVARRATRLAATLRGLGLRHDAGSAELLALRAKVAAGDTPPAEQRAPARRALAADVPLDVRLLHRLTRAELHRADGRPRAALDELRKGLVTLQEHRRRFGSLELQSSVAALGADLGAYGLDISWSLGPPSLVFNWSERSRAQSFRIRSVLPPQDPQIAEALAELRQLRRAVRLGELEGRPEPLLRARCADLEQSIRRHGWWAGDTEESHGAATHTEVAAELARAGRCMVSYLVRRDRLHALVLAGGAITSVELGPYAPVAESVRRLLSDLDTAADRRLPAKLAAVVRASADRQAATLDQALIAPVLAALGPHDVVVVPTRQLAVLPWGLLPSLRGRPVAVAPSASVWLAARTAANAVTTGAPLLVAGPDLVHADAEIDAIARLYPRGRVLRGADATATSVLAGMDAAPVVHVAAHGHHDTQNVLFSRLELGDGPLLAYELQRLGTAPGQVVLSACDVGRAVVRAGDELVGFTAALLHAGTANVVASVARIPDELGPAVMAHHHRAVALGVSPARALADLPEATPFVCFGAG
ncbi:CHAT domain-containing protein [Dactylosporangium sp. NPDC050588]|uniref:CHAT domain-containing protein n=1 Tax=Dactylosporangium sp. NPDC050588 TaxID=3157211 RepID=UPI0033DB824A